MCFTEIPYQDEDTPPQEHISPQITNEVIGPELVHVSEKNLSEIENVHGFVSLSYFTSKGKIITEFCCYELFVTFVINARNVL